MELSDNHHESYESEIAQRVKEQKALDKFLASSGCCIFCQVIDPLVLEEHHVAGRKHSGVTITVCANHHAILSRMQGSWPKEWLHKDLPIQMRQALFLRGISDILRLMSDEMLGIGDGDNRGLQ